MLASHKEPKSTDRQCYLYLSVTKTIWIYFSIYNQAFQVALLQLRHTMFAAVCASIISISLIKENIQSGLLVRESDSHILWQLCCLHMCSLITSLVPSATVPTCSLAQKSIYQHKTALGWPAYCYYFIAASLILVPSAKVIQSGIQDKFTGK